MSKSYPQAKWWVSVALLNTELFPELVQTCKGVFCTECFGDNMDPDRASGQTRRLVDMYSTCELHMSREPTPVALLATHINAH